MGQSDEDRQTHNNTGRVSFSTIGAVDGLRALLDDEIMVFPMNSDDDRMNGT